MIRLIKTVPLVGCLLLSLAFEPAVAESFRYEEPIRYRQAVMTMSKRHFDQISAIAKGRQAFSREEALKHATYLDLLAQVSIDGFVAGSHEGDTKAKPEIWRDWATYRGLNDKYRNQTARLKEIARTATSAEALKPAIADLTRACKACHDDYKASSVGN